DLHRPGLELGVGKLLVGGHGGGGVGEGEEEEGGEGWGPVFTSDGGCGGPGFNTKDTKRTKDTEKRGLQWRPFEFISALLAAKSNPVQVPTSAEAILVLLVLKFIAHHSALSFSSRGAILRDQVSGSMGPTCLKRTRPRRSTTKVSGKPVTPRSTPVRP